MSTFNLRTLISFSLIFSMTSIAIAENNPSIEEVIVSSEKRDESLQDISQSVTALTEQELEIKT